MDVIEYQTIKAFRELMYATHYYLRDRGSTNFSKYTLFLVYKLTSITKSAIRSIRRCLKSILAANSKISKTSPSFPMNG